MDCYWVYKLLYSEEIDSEELIKDLIFEYNLEDLELNILTVIAVCRFLDWCFCSHFLLMFVIEIERYLNMLSSPASVLL